MSEIERVYEVEVVEDRPSWEEIKSEWAMGAHQKLGGQLRQARALRDAVNVGVTAYEEMA